MEESARGGGLAIPQVFSYPDNKSKLSDELSENAHQQVSPTNPSLWAWNDKFDQGFPIIVNLIIVENLARLVWSGLVTS